MHVIAQDRSEVVACPHTCSFRGDFGAFCDDCTLMNDCWTHLQNPRNFRTSRCCLGFVKVKLGATW